MIKQPRITTNYLWNGWQSMNPIGTIIHNDYGRMDVKGYEDWLKRNRASNPELGFAHDYIDRNGIGHFVPTNRAAYHAGDGHGTGNSRYIGIEVNQSRGPEFGDITQAQFIENENMALRQSAEYHHKYGWNPNRDTVRLHNQFAKTSCPHLSQTIHGQGVKVQDYFIAKVKEYMKLGKTVKEIIDAENGGKSVKPSTAKPQPAKPKPVTGKQTLHLPASAETWRVYKPGGPYTKGNEIHLLTPSAYGGIDYEIKGNPAKDVYLIDTGVKGRVAIYAAPSTGAKITGSKAPVAKPKPKGKRLYLPASAKLWKIYHPKGPYTSGSEIHNLTPSAYGGLDYEIKGNPAPHVYLIDTGVKGRVAIYAHPSTGAVIK